MLATDAEISNVVYYKKVDGGYWWFKHIIRNKDGCTVLDYNTDLLCDIIKANRFNQIDMQYKCQVGKTVDPLTASYISFVDEDEFLADYDKYIENAYEKSHNDAYGYRLTIED